MRSLGKLLWTFVYDYHHSDTCRCIYVSTVVVLASRNITACNGQSNGKDTFVRHLEQKWQQNGYSLQQFTACCGSLYNNPQQIRSGGV